MFRTALVSASLLAVGASGSVQAAIIAYSKTQSFLQKVSVANGAKASASLSFSPDTTGGNILSTKISLYTNGTYTGYSVSPVGTSTGLLSTGNTSIQYDLSNYGLSPVTHFAGLEVRCLAAKCGPGESATVSFTSVNQISNLSENTKALGGNIDVLISSSQTSYSGGVYIEGTQALNGVATITRVEDLPSAPPPDSIELKHESYSRASALYGILSTYLGGAALFTPCTVFCGEASLGFGVASTYFALEDPADFDFTEVAQVTPGSTPLLTSTPFLGTSADLDVQKLFVDLDMLKALIDTTYISLNRATGAEESGEGAYQQLQLTAAAYYLSQEQIYNQSIGADLRQLSTLPLVAGLPDDFDQNLAYQANAISSLKFGSPIPEPSSYLFAMLGFGLVGSFIRKRNPMTRAKMIAI